VDQEDVRATTSLLTADAAPHTCPGRPSSWRTLLLAVRSGKLENRSLAGSNRTNA
jgi:hypothetical protein